MVCHQRGEVYPILTIRRSDSQWIVGSWLCKSCIRAMDDGLIEVETHGEEIRSGSKNSKRSS